MNRSQSIRINAIRKAPLSWKEKDILTGAERYMDGMMNLSIIELTSPYFSGLSQERQAQIDLVWKYQLASYHLKNGFDLHSESTTVQELKYKASNIYELEAQRMLGAIFLLESNFWKAFYKRQEVENDKILIAIDALHFATKQQSPIAYQLLIQAFREILKGQYTLEQDQTIHFEKAKRLLVDLSIPQLRLWLDQLLST